MNTSLLNSNRYFQHNYTHRIVILNRYTYIGNIFDPANHSRATISDMASVAWQRYITDLDTNTNPNIYTGGWTELTYEEYVIACI